MKKTIILLLTFCVICCAAFAQTYQKKMKSDGKTFNNRAAQTSDGGFVDVGVVNYDSSENVKVVVSKFDQNINLQWQKSFNDTAVFAKGVVSPGIEQTSDGGYVISVKIGGADPNEPLFVFKINASGNRVWSKKIFSTAAFKFYSKVSSALLPDGGLVMTGQLGTTSGKFPYLIKLNSSNGTIAWVKALSLKQDSSNNTIATNVSTASNGNVTVSGYFTRDTNYFPFICTYDANGNTLLQKTFIIGVKSTFDRVVRTPDNGYIIAGQTYYTGAIHFDLLAVRLTSTGTVSWVKKISFPLDADTINTRFSEIVSSMQLNADESTVLTGYLYRRNSTAGHILKIDKAGNPVWLHSFETIEPNQGWNYTDLFKMGDSAYMMAGNVTKEGGHGGPSQQYLLFQKTFADGMGCNVTPLQPYPYTLRNTDRGVTVISADFTANVSLQTTNLNRTGIHYKMELICTDILPLNLVFFTASKNNSVNTLKWRTAQEINVERIEVQKSTDSRNFIVLGSVPPKGTSLNDYLFTDTKPFDGNNYYRLVIVNKDGSKTISEIRQLNNAILAGITITPNPVKNGILNIGIKGLSSKNVQLSVIDMKGTVVYTQSMETANGYINKSVNIANLPVGMYGVKITDGKQVHVTKFVKAD